MLKKLLFKHPNQRYNSETVELSGLLRYQSEICSQMPLQKSSYYIAAL